LLHLLLFLQSFHFRVPMGAATRSGPAEMFQALHPCLRAQETNHGTAW